MPEKCKTIVETMEGIAPLYLAETWDNVGLQIGNPSKIIHRIMICLEVTHAILDEAIAKNIDLIIAHHPLIFKPIKAVRTDDAIGKMIHRLIQRDIALYCAHTNLDIASGGINDLLTQIFNIKETKPLIGTEEEKYFKLYVYVPLSHMEEVREALCSMDAGHIGNYSHCTFQIEGIGTFKPLAGTTPFIGEQGKMEKVQEYKLETIVSRENLPRVIKKMIEVHPYEEVAYDIIPLCNEIHHHGLGRVGSREQSILLSSFCEEVKQKLGLKYVKLIGDKNKMIQKIGLCSGSGAEFIYEAYRAGCDCYITGDIKYHDAQYALQLGIPVIDAGHFETENIMCKGLEKILKQLFLKKNYDVEIMLPSTNINPFTIL
jgi:dinuclear metal center YbgI/SA1388 family protein